LFYFGAPNGKNTMDRAYAHYERAAMYDALGKDAKAAAHLRRGMEYGLPRQLLLKDAPNPKLVWTKGATKQHWPRKAPVARGPEKVAAPRQWGEIGGKFTYAKPEEPEEPLPAKPVGPLLGKAYKVLGARPNEPKTSGFNAKERYKKLALQFHPDRSTSAAELESFRRVQAAWDTLREHNAKFGRR